MSSGGESARGVSYEPLIDVIAFFVAMRNYGYADAIGNALERSTVLEALGSALRDFRSVCIDASPESRARLAERGVRCPSITAEELEGAVDSFNRILSSLEGRGGLVQFLREFYVKALARASKFKIGSQEGGEQGG